MDAFMQYNLDSYRPVLFQPDRKL